jgi:outer membrane usher protein FimD/PapC
LPSGLPVLRGGNEFFSSTVQGGRVMVDQMVEDDMLYVELPDGQRCLLQDIRTRPRADGDLFENGTAVCK